MKIFLRYRGEVRWGWGDIVTCLIIAIHAPSVCSDTAMRPLYFYAMIVYTLPVSLCIFHFHTKQRLLSDDLSSCEGFWFHIDKVLCTLIVLSFRDV